MNITTVYEEILLGTGGTLLKNREFFQGESAMLVHADKLSKIDVHDFIRKYEGKENDIEITMMTFYTDVPETCGIVERDERGIVREFHEKVKYPPGNLASRAVYIVSPVVMDFLVGLCKEVIDFRTEVLLHFIGRINTFHNHIYHRDIGTVESVSIAQREYPTAIGTNQPTDLRETSA